MDAREYMMKNRPPLIGFLGIRKSGKSEAALYLHRTWQYSRVRVAQPLKDMLLAAGLSTEEVDGSLKELPCERLNGKSPRFAMQTLGTEWGRDIMGDDFWMNTWLSRVKQTELCCVDDIRFPNEAKALKELGGILIRIDRPGVILDEHISENALANEVPDLVITNDGSVEDLHRKLDALVTNPQRRPTMTDRA